MSDDLPVSFGPDPTTIAEVTVPAGNYLVQGVLTMSSSEGTYLRVVCELSTGAIDEFDLPPSGGEPIMMHIALFDAASVAAGPISMSCAPDGNNLAFINEGSLFATQVASVIEQVN